MLKLPAQYLHLIHWEDVIQKILEVWEYIYIGKSIKWTLTSEAKWKIQRIKTDWEILWSDSNIIFDDAESVDYS